MKNENLFQKNEYSFLVESTKIENVIFPYKNTVSKANRITNKNREYRMNQRMEFCR